MARGALDDIAFYGVLIGGSVLGYKLAVQGTFGSTIQNLAQSLQGGLGGAISQGSPSSGGGSGSCSSAAVQQWASGIRLPTWVGSLYCQQNGQLPQSIPALQSWGQSKGYLQGTNWVQPVGT